MHQDYSTKLVGTAQDLGDNRFGVLVERDGATYYFEHQVTANGLRAQVWNEDDDELLVERTMDWNEVVERMFTAWQSPPSDAA